MRRLRFFLLCALVVACVTMLPPRATAQHGGGGHGGGMGPGGFPGGGMGPGGGFDRDRGDTFPRRAPDSAGTRSGTQLGLAGRWWDDKHLAKDLNLRPEQRRRMDDIFESNRPALVRSLQTYEQEQGRLDAMYRSKKTDETSLYAQIDRVSQARAELGKAYTHFMLQIRGEMDGDQLQRLDSVTKPDAGGGKM